MSFIIWYHKIFLYDIIERKEGTKIKETKIEKLAVALALRKTSKKKHATNIMLCLQVLTPNSADI